MTTQQITPETIEQTPPRCPHYWVIQQAEGPVSLGTCQICGQEKEFKNYVEASTWGDDRAASRSRAAIGIGRASSGHREDEEEE